MLPRPILLTWLAHATAVLLAAIVAGSPVVARAQGVTVTVPPGGTPNLPEILVPNEPPPPAAKPPPKPKPAGPSAMPGTPPKSAAIKPGGDGTEGKIKGGGQSIAVLVNDEPITGYEITQRQRLMGMGNANIGERAQANFKSLIKSKSTNDRLKAILEKTIKENAGKSREEIVAIFERRKTEFAKSLQQEAVESARQSVLPALRKEAMEELIEERLKLQEAKRLNVVVGEEEVDKIMRSIAEKNKMTDAEFAVHLKKMGADVNVMRNRFKASMSWQEVVRRRFGAQVAISDRDVDRFVEKSPGDAGNNVELQVQRIVLPLPGAMDQKLLAQRMVEAEGLVQRGGGCAQMSANAATVAGARFENLGPRSPNSIPEPTRSLLLSARDGEMIPPTVAGTGVEVWAVCGRKTVAADLERRQTVQAELRQKEFEVLAKKHLKDLRQDAAIEYR
jgi:peptidyl-prolyl cis-trans isomerase SurA